MLEQSCCVPMVQALCNASKLESMKGQEARDIQDMCTVAARPPVVAVAEPFVPVCADAFGFLSDRRGRRVEQRVRLSLSLKYLQCKTLACVEGCASLCQYMYLPVGQRGVISYQCGNASTKCPGCPT